MASRLQCPGKAPQRGPRPARQRTAEQRDRKRTQDREAQRNFRQRMREHITRLEARIADLEAPDHTARLLQANEQLEQRNQTLSAALDSISLTAHLAIVPSPGYSTSGEGTGNAAPPNQQIADISNVPTEPFTICRDSTDGDAQEQVSNSHILERSIHDSESSLVQVHAGPLLCKPLIVDETILPQICSPTNFWDEALCKFISEAQRRALPSSSQPSIGLLTDPNYRTSTLDPIGRFLAGYIHQWHFNLPERLGIFWLNYIYLSYRVYPSSETTARLPYWFVPGAAQCVVAHPVYIDTLPWPSIRTALTFRHGSYEYSSFLKQFCSTLNVNWHGSAAATYTVSPDGSVYISPEFESHIRILDNWSLKPSFVTRFPELAGAVNIR